MKKLFVSVGLIAAGTAGLQAAYAPDANTMTASKVWSVAGTLRGFYDSNYQTSTQSKGSWGFEVSPEVDLNLSLQQTELGARYTYGMYYYQERENLGQNPIDQTHQADLWLDHAFNERWQARATDSFVIGQEPELIDPNTSVTTRTDGNNLRNTANLSVNTLWTRLFSTKLGYGNTYFDYQNSGTTTANLSQGASLAALLNRIEQTVSLDLQWEVAPETLAFLGGMFGWADYTGNQPISENIATAPFTYYYSDTQNNRSYYVYVGVERTMLANLSFTGRVGFQYTDFYNNPNTSSSTTPYADISLIYTYLPGSYVQFGFTQTQNATSQVQAQNTGQITSNTESSTTYASLNHKLTPKLLGTVIGRWQHSIYNGGAYNNQFDNYYSLGLNFSYTFTPHLSAEAGYNLDNVSSQIPGNDYTRNRVYLGVTAAY